MPAKLRVSDYEKTYSEVKNDESNVLHQLTVWDQRNKFFTHLHENETTIQAITAHHLGLKVQDCQLAGPEEWRYGSYNACIPIYISSGKKQSTTKRVMIRFPLPYKVGGPENGDEKLRCEAATYIWLQQNCPSVPIPRLHGFGLSTGQKVSHLFISFQGLANNHPPDTSSPPSSISLSLSAWPTRSIAGCATGSNYPCFRDSYGDKSASTPLAPDIS